MSSISLFDELCYHFQDTVMDANIIPLPNTSTDQASYFGIVKIGVKSCEICTLEQDFLFVIDCSGSMSDICSDGKTKMQHISYTLKNMFKYFCDKKYIHVTVSVFDNIFETIVARTRITNNNIDKLYELIDNSMQPRSTTNIENALIASNTIIKLLQDQGITSINMIFMTDGEITEGSNDFNVLENLVQTNNVKKVFIGFGTDHDDSLLQHLSKNINSSYYFIDILERAGLVYGEIINDIMFRLFSNPQITISNGFIYDYKSNEWKNTININDIVGDSNKTYHIASTVPDLCEIILTCKNIEDNANVETFCIGRLFPLCQSSYIMYIYRQRVLQLLYEVNEFNSNNKNLIRIPHFNHIPHIPHYPAKKQPNKISINDLKLKMNYLITEIKQVLNPDLKIIEYYNNLCKDLEISLKMIGTKYANMYSSARQVSQGNQRYYTVTLIPDELFYDTKCDYHLFETTPYASQSAQKIMREITGIKMPEDKMSNSDYDKLLNLMEQNM
jgi:hypothetical protein